MWAGELCPHTIFRQTRSIKLQRAAIHELKLLKESSVESFFTWSSFCQLWMRNLSSSNTWWQWGLEWQPKNCLLQYSISNNNKDSSRSCRLLGMELWNKPSTRRAGQGRLQTGECNWMASLLQSRTWKGPNPRVTEKRKDESDDAGLSYSRYSHCVFRITDFLKLFP